MDSKAFFQELLFEDVVKITLSDKKNNQSNMERIVVVPKLIKNMPTYQFTFYIEDKVLHKNIQSQTLYLELSHYFDHFKQCLVKTIDTDYQLFFNKDGLQVLKKQANNRVLDLSHNLNKNYILEDGKFIPFFYELKVMDINGKVIPAKYNKFRQINRYLEFIKDILYLFPKEKQLKMIDFGCGKSYLTFATYYYLHNILGYNVEIIGLDLKADVISFCNQLAIKCQMEHLKFEIGDIGSYEKLDHVDIVFSLHACDIATDLAIAKAVKHKAKVILAVPCCQHEVNQQIKSNMFPSLLDQGIIKERLAAILTDVARNEILGAVGYKSQIVEFIETEHTPKNLLIKAIQGENDRLKHLQNLLDLKREFSFGLTLEKLLKEELEK